MGREASVFLSPADEPEDGGGSCGEDEEDKDRKGTNGVSTNGSLQILCFLTEELFGVLPLTYFYLPKSARAYLFPQSVKTHCFCSGPISVDPICPQPKGVWPRLGHGRRAARERGPRGPGAPRRLPQPQARAAALRRGGARDEVGALPARRPVRVAGGGQGEPLV